MFYFAYVTRGSDGIYRAELVDLPGCQAVSRRLTLLSDAVNESVRSFIASRFTPLPLPTQLMDLPKRSDEGYWMAFDVGAVVKGFPYGFLR